MENVDGDIAIKEFLNELEEYLVAVEEWSGSLRHSCGLWLQS